mmetsp:Transcript_41313/g.103801  ORF Transcript_41313/g.103801 Transcript_41313/m.103801 type:complete len:253 (-) Transcript_41313:554-1312(-)
MRIHQGGGAGKGRGRYPSRARLACRLSQPGMMTSSRHDAPVSRSSKLFSPRHLPALSTIRAASDSNDKQAPLSFLHPDTSRVFKLRATGRLRSSSLTPSSVTAGSDCREIFSNPEGGGLAVCTAGATPVMASSLTRSRSAAKRRPTTDALVDGSVAPMFTWPASLRGSARGLARRGVGAAAGSSSTAAGRCAASSCNAWSPRFWHPSSLMLVRQGSVRSSVGMSWSSSWKPRTSRDCRAPCVPAATASNRRW